MIRQGCSYTKDIGTRKNQRKSWTKICNLTKKHPQKQAEPATLLKVTLPHGCFSCLLNCAVGTKSRNTSHI